MTCHTTHHLACDCREHKVAVLIKAALDAASDLDVAKNLYSAPEDKERAQSFVERTYTAVEALGVEIGAICEHPITNLDGICLACGVAIAENEETNL